MISVAPLLIVLVAILLSVHLAVLHRRSPVWTDHSGAADSQQRRYFGSYHRPGHGRSQRLA